MTLTRSRSHIIFNYSINWSTLMQLDKSVNYLGFVFTPTLTPNMYIDQTYSQNSRFY